MATERDTSTPPTPEDAPTEPTRSWIVPAFIGATLLVLVVPVLALMMIMRSTPPATHTYVVPAGTAALIARGETVDVMPSEVRLNAGDHLVLRNDDQATHVIGPFTVRPGETVDQPFDQPGVYKGACSFGHAEIRIVVL